MPVAEQRQTQFPIMEDGDYVSSASSSDDIVPEKDKSFSASNRRVLTQVLARKDRDAKKVHGLLRLAFSKLDQETQRAVDAERRATECLVRARNAIDARTLAEAEAARTREELGMYKVQLDQAQREILRAQELLDSLEARRRDAEEEAARARSVARKLQEQRAVDLAREEGRKAGWREGVERGWRMGWEEAIEERRVRNGRTRPRPRRSLQEVLFEDEEPEEPRVEYEQSSEESSLVNIPSRGVPEAGNGFALPFGGAPHEPTPHTPAIATPITTLTTPFRPPPPDTTRFDPGLGRQRTHERVREQSRHRTPEPTYVHYQTPDPVPIRYQAPDVRRHRTHEPRFAPPTTYDYVDPGPAPVPMRPTTPSAHSRPYGPHDDEPSPIRPLASFLSPVHRPISIPPDGFIPYAQDLANDTGQAAIRLPPPHELADPIRGRHNPVVVISTPEGGSPVPVGSASDDGPRASTSRTGDMRNGSAPRRPPVPPSAIPPRISKEPSSHSRASTHLSEYELLHPPRTQSAMGRMRTPTQTNREDREYAHSPSEGSRAAPPFRPHSSQNHRGGEHAHRRASSRGGPRPPREIVLPVPLAPAVEQLARPHSRPSTAVDPSHLSSHRDPEFSPQIERSRPRRSRTTSSGVIDIVVEPPSPNDSPPSPNNGTVVTHPDFLSPEYAPQSLPMHNDQPRDSVTLLSSQPSPLQDFINIPIGFAPPVTKQKHKRREGSREREPVIYETAPIPPGVEYPGSPLTQPDHPHLHASARQGGNTDGESGSDPEAPLSPLSGEGLKNLFPGRLWRRFTADR